MVDALPSVGDHAEVGEVTASDGSAKALVAGRGRVGRPLCSLLVGALLMGALVAHVAAYTGLPGPEWLRRYPERDLFALAARIDAANDRAVVCGSRPALEPRARVDPIRSRVVVPGGQIWYSLTLAPGEREMIAGPAGRWFGGNCA